MQYEYKCIYCIYKDQCWGTESIQSHLPRFSFYLFPFYLSVYLFEIPETKNSVYFIHLNDIPSTYINHVPNTQLMYIYIHKTRPNNPSVDFNFPDQRGTCSFLENIDDMYTSLPLKRIIHPNMSITVGFLHGPHTRCDMCQFSFYLCQLSAYMFMN